MLKKNPQINIISLRWHCTKNNLFCLKNFSTTMEKTIFLCFKKYDRKKYFLKHFFYENVGKTFEKRENVQEIHARKSFRFNEQFHF